MSNNKSQRKIEFSPKYNLAAKEYFERKEKEKLAHLEKIKSEGHFHEFVNSFFDIIGYTLQYDKEYIDTISQQTSETFYESNYAVKFNRIKNYSKSFKVNLSLVVTDDNTIDISIKCNHGEFINVRKSLVIDLMKIVNDYGLNNTSDKTISQKNIWDWVEL